MGEYNILIIDDHEIIVSGVSNILQREFPHASITTSSTPQQTITEIDSCSFDLYIIDLEFEKMNGFDLINEIKRQEPSSKIIVYTSHNQIWTLNRLLDTEVNGIVLKCSEKDNLIEAVNEVLKNEMYICPKFREIEESGRTYKELLRTRRNKSSPLTEMESTVLKYIVKGYQSSEIAEKISRSIHDVNFHRKNILLKLEARNVADLVAKAITMRLVEIE